MSSSSPIAMNIGMIEVVGSLLTGASMILTTHSLCRMIFLRRTASKYHLFPIINAAQFVNQICIFLLLTTSLRIISFDVALWLNVINNTAYFITKPICMYLAYLRCSAVYPAFRKADWLHYFLIGFRAIELLAIVVINIIQNQLCNGSTAPGTQCAKYAIAWTFRDAGAPVFRFYYIICEAIFYVKLFKTLKGMNPGKNPQLIQYRRLQTTLFTVDLALLVFMSIYRIIGIFDKDLPTYVYYELFSSTLTIFNLTEFGLNIRILFHTITEAKTSSDPSSTGPNKMEMGTINRNQSQNGALASSTLATNSRFLDDPYGDHNVHKLNSSSPLTSFPGETGYSDYDLSAPNTTVSSPYISSSSSRSRPITHNDFDDYIPYNSTSSASVSQTFSPRVGVIQQDQFIIPPSNFQTQAHTGFNEASSSPKEDNRNSGSISRPSRALVPPRRKTDDTLQG